MANRKIYDLAVRIGSYTDKSGEKKSRWQNVGALFENDKGRFIMLARWFNPAGVPTETSVGESIPISCFEPRSGAVDAAQERRNGPSVPKGGVGGSDDIPF